MAVQDPDGEEKRKDALIAASQELNLLRSRSPQHGEELIDWTDAKDPKALQFGVRTAKRKALVQGRVLTLAPLRNRRSFDGREVTSRIAEGFTEYTWNGRTGLGICDFIEVLDGCVPAGFPL